jgi:hypothetical protein
MAGLTISASQWPSKKKETYTSAVLVERQGGHLPPVTFDCDGRKLQPFSIGPWWNEKLDKKSSHFCGSCVEIFSPFGGNVVPFRGETANRKWRCFGLSKEGGGKWPSPPCSVEWIAFGG